MSGYKGHLIGSAIVTAITLTALWYFLNITFSLKELPIIVLIIYVYSLLPDIDHPISKITWTILTLGALLLVNGIFHKILGTIDTLYLGVIVTIAPIVVNKITKHRGVTHTVQFGALMSLLLWLVPNLPNRWLLIAVAFVSFQSHLWLDGYIFKLTPKPKEGMW